MAWEKEGWKEEEVELGAEDHTMRDEGQGGLKDEGGGERWSPIGLPPKKKHDMDGLLLVRRFFWFGGDQNLYICMD